VITRKKASVYGNLQSVKYDCGGWPISIGVHISQLHR
jgi:hypothetical protein